MVVFIFTVFSLISSSIHLSLFSFLHFFYPFYVSLLIHIFPCLSLPVSPLNIIVLSVIFLPFFYPLFSSNLSSVLPSFSSSYISFITLSFPFFLSRYHHLFYPILPLFLNHVFFISPSFLSLSSFLLLLLHMLLCFSRKFLHSSFIHFVFLPPSLPLLSSSCLPLSFCPFVSSSFFLSYKSCYFSPTFTNFLHINLSKLREHHFTKLDSYFIQSH